MQCLVLHALITPANVQDRDSGLHSVDFVWNVSVSQKALRRHAYQGRAFQTALESVLPHLETEIIRRSRGAKGFVALPKR